MEENNDLGQETVKPTEGRGMGIASMVLGIISIVLTCIIYVALPCAIVGLILGIIARKKGQRGMATAGVVCSSIGIALFVIMIILTAIGVAAFGSMSSSLLNDVKYSSYYY